MIPSLRKAQITDINNMIDIDIKSYMYPWSLKQWRAVTIDPACDITVATIKMEPIAVCIWQKNSKNEAEILKLATKPAYRGHAAGTLLLHSVSLAAVKQGLKRIIIIIPEINCFPGHPDDVSVWLLERMFTAVKPILKDRFIMYGQPCDGYKFVLEIGA